MIFSDHYNQVVMTDIPSLYVAPSLRGGSGFRSESDTTVISPYSLGRQSVFCWLLQIDEIL
jgi:hypothetical protein